MIFTIFISLLLVLNIQTHYTKNTSAEIVVPSSNQDRQKHTVDADFFVMKTIVINSPKYGIKKILIDDIDFSHVKKLTWTLKRSRKHGFSIAAWFPSFKKSFSLARYIAKVHLDISIKIVHIDGNPFNNTRKNIQKIFPNKYINHGNFYELKIHSHRHGWMSSFFDSVFLNLIKPYQWRVFKSSISHVYYAASFQIVNGKMISFFMHQIIMGVNERQIDHINMNGLNNRCENLRLATISQNKQNRGKTSNNTSGYKGVTWHANRFAVQITANKVHYYGGRFSCPIRAAKRYNELALKYHGEFARLNIIPNE